MIENGELNKLNINNDDIYQSFESSTDNYLENSSDSLLSEKSNNISLDNNKIFNYLDDLNELTFDNKEESINKHKKSKNKNILKDKSNLINKPGFLKGKF